MRFHAPQIHALLGYVYAALALASVQSLWPVLPNPPLLWCLLSALPGALIAGGLSWLSARRQPSREPKALEWILLANAALLWGFIALQELPGVPMVGH